MRPEADADAVAPGSLRPAPSAHAASSWRRAVRRVLASQDEVAAGEERTRAALEGTDAIGDLRPRSRASFSGIVRSAVLRPSDRVRAVEAELYDGSGSIDLVWLGRRRIAGIEPGRRIRVEGFVCAEHGRHVMYNPRYDLLPSGVVTR